MDVKFVFFIIAYMGMYMYIKSFFINFLITVEIDNFLLTFLISCMGNLNANLGGQNLIFHNDKDR